MAGTSEKKPRVEAALDDVDFEEVDPFEDDELAALDYDQLLFGPAAASTSKKSSKEPAPTAAITSTINARAREKGKGKALTAAEAVDVDIFEDDYDEEIGDLDLEGLNAVMQKSHPTTTTAISDDDERFDAVRGGVAGTRSGHFAKAGTGKGKGKRTAVEDSEEDGDEEVEIVQGPAKRAPTAASRKASAGKPAMPVVSLSTSPRLRLRLICSLPAGRHRARLGLSESMGQRASNHLQTHGCRQPLLRRSDAALYDAAVRDRSPLSPSSPCRRPCRTPTPRPLAAHSHLPRLADRRSSPP